METKRFFRFEISITVLVSSFWLIWIPMLWVYGHYNFFYFYRTGIDFSRQNLTFIDVRFWRLKSIPRSGGWSFINGHWPEFECLKWIVLLQITVLAYHIEHCSKRICKTTRSHIGKVMWGIHKVGIITIFDNADIFWLKCVCVCFPCGRPRWLIRIDWDL